LREQTGFFATFLYNPTYSDLIDLVIGGILFSSGFANLLPRGLSIPLPRCLR
jgi:hypothetical protein